MEIRGKLAFQVDIDRPLMARSENRLMTKVLFVHREFVFFILSRILKKLFEAQLAVWIVSASSSPPENGMACVIAGVWFFCLQIQHKNRLLMDLQSRESLCWLFELIICDWFKANEGKVMRISPSGRVIQPPQDSKACLVSFWLQSSCNAIIES